MHKAIFIVKWYKILGVELPIYTSFHYSNKPINGVLFCHYSHSWLIDRVTHLFHLCWIFCLPELLSMTYVHLCTAWDHSVRALLVDWLCWACSLCSDHKRSQLGILNWLISVIKQELYQVFLSPLFQLITTFMLTLRSHADWNVGILFIVYLQTTCNFERFLQTHQVTRIGW
jgi:hypothetical protein